MDLARLINLVLIHLVIVLTSSICLNDAKRVLHAQFNSIGLRGNITFEQDNQEDSITISMHLSSIVPTDTPVQYGWSIHSNPAFYDLKSACLKTELGKAEHELSTKHGPIIIPAPNNSVQRFTDTDIKLEGIKTIWGKSIFVRNLNNSANEYTCANIDDGREVKTAEAVFTSPVAGRIIFRENEVGETLIHANIFNTGNDYKPVSKHEWRILVTDILDTKRHKQCDYLSALFDPDGVDEEYCSPNEHKRCKMGDLTKKHGMISVGTNNNRYSKLSVVDTNLQISSFLSGSRSLYVVLYEKNNLHRIMSCGEIHEIVPREVKAIFEMDGVKGQIVFSQRYRFDTTIMNVNLHNLMRKGKFFHIHEFPVPPRANKDDNVCSGQSVGAHFNPFKVNSSLSPAPGMGTNDQYEIGDLSGKHGTIDNSDRDHFGIHVDMNLPLFGPNSIIGRSVVIHKPNGDRWICASIGYPNTMVTATATFHYPAVGQVIFRQEKNKPWSETTVFTDLSYSDGSVNNTENHAWHVHINEPGRDFYNWSRRCDSAGPHFNPFTVGVAKYTQCNPDNPMRCELGDLASKSMKIKISASKGSFQSKLFYTDILLPLSGPHSIVGRSVVVHDDHAPVQRGNRMACTPIRYVPSITVAVRYWKVGTGVKSNVTGSIVLTQASEYDLTYSKVDLFGLNKLAGGFHVHQVWVPKDKEFPCSNDSVYEHFNPFETDVSIQPSPKAGSEDQYEVGDLSSKYGMLDHQTSFRFQNTDSNLPLHGPNSIIGRSVVIHKKERNFRWLCGTIKPEEPKGGVREIVGLASFDDPRNKITGFIRLIQFEYKDGSTSNTWIEVDLRHQGLHNRNITTGHKWAVFVNQVGVDAYNNFDDVRCLAAGYRWNPYLSNSENKLYKKDCGKHNPLRCEMGDLNGKHGYLAIGGKRGVHSDINLPLIGNYSVMGRSIVIYDKNDSNTKLACSNIKPDVHLVTNVAVKRHPQFTVQKFMDHMRLLLNTTEWLVEVDIQQTKDILDGECIQLSVNFYGFNAHKLQLEFSNLINLGSVKRSDRFGTQTISTYYKPCRTLNELNTNSATMVSFNSVQIIIFYIVCWIFKNFNHNF